MPIPARPRPVQIWLTEKAHTISCIHQVRLEHPPGETRPEVVAGKLFESVG